MKNPALRPHHFLIVFLILAAALASHSAVAGCVLDEFEINLGPGVALHQESQARIETEIAELKNEVDLVTQDKTRISGISDPENWPMKTLVQANKVDPANKEYPAAFIDDSSAQTIRAALKGNSVVGDSGEARSVTYAQLYPNAPKVVKKWVEDYSSLASREESAMRAYATKREKYLLLLKARETHKSFPIEIELPVAGSGGIGETVFKPSQYTSREMLDADILAIGGRKTSDILKAGKLRPTTDLHFMRSLFADQATNRRRLEVLRTELVELEDQTDLPFNRLQIWKLLDDTNLLPPKDSQSAADLEILSKEMSAFSALKRTFPESILLNDIDKNDLGIGEASLKPSKRLKQYILTKAVQSSLIAFGTWTAFRVSGTAALTWTYLTYKLDPTYIEQGIAKSDDQKTYDAKVEKFFSIKFNAHFDSAKNTWMGKDGNPSADANAAATQLKKFRTIFLETQAKEDQTVEKKKLNSGDLGTSYQILEKNMVFLFLSRLKAKSDPEFVKLDAQLMKSIQGHENNPAFVLKKSIALFEAYSNTHPELRAEALKITEAAPDEVIVLPAAGAQPTKQ